MFWKFHESELHVGLSQNNGFYAKKCLFGQGYLITKF